MGDMAVRLLPMISLMAFASPDSQAIAAPETALRLEKATAATPFHAGDHLQLDVKISGEAEAETITVVDTAHWPWVLVRFEKGSKPGEVWINFAQVRSACRVAAGGASGSK